MVSKKVSTKMVIRWSIWKKKGGQGSDDWELKGKNDRIWWLGYARLFGFALGVQVESDHGKLGEDEGQRKVLAERHGEFDPGDLDPEMDRIIQKDTKTVFLLYLLWMFQKPD